MCVSKCKVYICIFSKYYTKHYFKYHSFIVTVHYCLSFIICYLSFIVYWLLFIILLIFCVILNAITIILILLNIYKTYNSFNKKQFISNIFDLSNKDHRSIKVPDCFFMNILTDLSLSRWVEELGNAKISLENERLGSPKVMGAFGWKMIFRISSWVNF